MEQSAHEGQVLASKAIIERLSTTDAQALGLAPETLAYRTIAELPGAPEKATRDAGAIAVIDLGEARARGRAVSESAT
jgi:hypothetical protein